MEAMRPGNVQRQNPVSNARGVSFFGTVKSGDHCEEIQGGRFINCFLFGDWVLG